MKNSVFKIIKHWLNKPNFYKLKNSLNKEKIFLSIPVVLLLIVFFYFLKPLSFDYQSGKKNLEEKINSAFNLKANIGGNISYKLFPSPRLIVENIGLDFNNSEKRRTKIEKIFILISPLKIQNLQSFELNKILIVNQKIKIYSQDFKNYFKYFTLQKQNTIDFKDSEIFFVDEQGNTVVFEKVNLEENFGKNKHQISGNTIFSKNQIKLKFVNNINSEKYLKINIPNLNQSLDVKFDSTTTMDNFIGELKLKVLGSILLLNFQGRDNFAISNSYLRNKFLNSKIKGKISFKKNFYFDLDLGINQINLRKLLMYYPVLQGGGVSKKINGKFAVILKSADSFFGKIKDAKMDLIFENGDIRIKKFSAFLPGKSKIESNILILNNDKRPKINFNINFYTNDPVKFFRKFGLYDIEQTETSMLAGGYIDLNTQKINFTRIIKNNNEKFGKKDLVFIGSAFNEHVIKDGILGLFDFFKIKKFLQEVY